MARVFVSYACQDARHRLLVGRLCEFLHECGAEVRLDELAGYDRRDWSLWAIEEILAADFIVVVASANYRVRAEGVLPAGSGDGVAGEAAFLRDRLAYDRRTWQRKILPVVLPGGRVNQIPLFLLPYSSSRYEVTAFTREGAAPLLRALRLPTSAMPGRRLPLDGSRS